MNRAAASIEQRQLVQVNEGGVSAGSDLDLIPGRPVIAGRRWTKRSPHPRLGAASAFGR